MSETLIRHLWRTQPVRIVSGSYLDCHAKGLHSLMLIDAPGAIVRMFVATPDHEMHRNFGTGAKLSIAFHSHDADLTLHVLRGQIANVTMDPDDDEGSDLTCFRYSSKIREGCGGFEKIGTAGRAGTRLRWMGPGASLFMRASDYHTVGVSAGEGAAWFVYEGAKDPGYQALAYSNDDLEAFTTDGLYRRPSIMDVQELFEQAIGGRL